MVLRYSPVNGAVPLPILTKHSHGKLADRDVFAGRNRSVDVTCEFHNPTTGGKLSKTNRRFGGGGGFNPPPPPTTHRPPTPAVTDTLAHCLLS